MSQFDRPTQKKSIPTAVKGGIAGAIAVVALICGFMFHHTVPVGEEAAVSSWGEVQMGVIKKGSGMKWPTETYDSYNLQNRTYEHPGKGIASQDKFKTTMTIVYTGKFLPGYADKIRNGTGVSDVFLSTYVHRTVLSCSVKAGTTIATSQDFFLEPTQVAMAEYTMKCVNEYLESDEVGGGYELTKVQFTNMVLDPRVDAFMVKTKERIEAEEQQKSDARIAASKEQEKVAAAKAKSEAALYAKTERAALADARLDEVTKEAQGNILLGKSISKDLVKYIEANRWNGSHATTVLADDAKLEYQLTK